MRVIVFSTLNPFKHSGGAERVALEISKRLVEKDIPVTQLYVDDKIMIPRKEVYSRNHTIIYIPWRRELTPLQFALGKIVKKFTPSGEYVFHIHSAMYGFLADWRTVFTYHGIARENLFNKFILRIALNNSKYVTVPSKKMTRFLKEKYDVKVCTIPNGVDTRLYKPINNLQKEENSALFVGRLERHKGVIDILRLAKILPKINFVIAGEGKLKTLVLEMSKSLKNVKYVGFLDELKKTYYYNRATIALFPSYRENFPLVGLEAMACGTAVVASNVGFDEYIMDKLNGFLLKPGDINAMKKCIELLINDNDLRKRIEKNALETARQYDWSVIVNKYFNLYLRLVRA